MNYVMRQGRRIEVVTINTGAAPPKKRRKSFRACWVKLPRSWITALRRSRSVHTYELALTILMEAYERQTDTITLSGEATQWMSRATKARAARELEEFGLIQVKGAGGGRRALKIVVLNRHTWG
jgi:hypothetical protein